MTDVDDLFALPPGEFVAARDALAKRLRADGAKEAAAEVKALPRPNAVAAALNALARTAGDELDALWAAAGSGRSAALREPLEALLDQVAGSPSTVAGVEAALRQAAADASVREQVVAGRLSREPDAEEADPLAAWAASLGGEVPPAPKAKKPGAAKKAEKPSKQDAEAERRAALEARLAEAQAREEETARAVDAAQAIAEERADAFTAAREAAERARAEAADAQKASRDAQAQAEEASEALVRARRAVKRLQAELD